MESGRLTLWRSKVSGAVVRAWVWAMRNPWLAVSGVGAVVALGVILTSERGPLLPWFLAIVDLMKGVAWPAAIVAAAILFRKDISAMVLRIRKLSPTSVELDPVEQRVEQRRIAPDAKLEASSVQLKDLPGLGRSAAIAELEKLLHVALEQEKVPHDDRVDRLVRLLAEARITAEFERIYRIIFGSQIRGLRILNQEGAVSVADARQRFNDVIKDFPDFYSANSFDPWLNFPTTVGLVATGEDDMLTLTPLGKDFLYFLTQRGYSEDKPY